MSAGSIPSSPTRAGLQVSRTINERVSGSSRHTHSSPYHHRNITGHISSSLHRLDRNRDERNSGIPAPAPALPMVQQQQQVTPRESLEASRSEATFSGNLSPGQSRTGSLLMPAGSDALGVRLGGGLSKEQQLLTEQRKTEARTAGIRKSLSELNTFSTMTTRRLDETYYNVLEKLTMLQNTIVALKDLAEASAATNDSFVIESQAVITEAETQLDAFGDFSEHQGRVQALHDRVHSGRERIAALSARVDVVRQRVEKWEQADRDWQQKTRRRLKIMWGVLFGLGLAVLVLSLGAKAYAPKMGEVVGGLQHEALMAKTKLENRVVDVAVDVGLGKAESKENDSVKLEFSRGGTTEQRAEKDEVLRALDEL